MTAKPERWFESRDRQITGLLAMSRQHKERHAELEKRVAAVEQAMLETAAALREAGIHRGGSWSLPSPSEDSDPASPSAALDLGRIPERPIYFVESWR